MYDTPMLLFPKTSSTMIGRPLPRSDLSASSWDFTWTLNRDELSNKVVMTGGIDCVIELFAAEGRIVSAAAMCLAAFQHSSIPHNHPPTKWARRRGKSLSFYFFHGCTRPGLVGFCFFLKFHFSVSFSLSLSLHASPLPVTHW